MVKFSEIISESIEWTGTVLFRPFRVKKWLLLTFVALLAGQLSSSLNSSSNYSPDKKQAQAATQDISQTPVSSQENTGKPVIDSLRLVKQKTIKFTSNSKFVPIVWGVGILSFLLVLFVSWLSSRATFVFIDDVLNNDASIRAPFRKFKKLGNSLFGFFLVAGSIFLALLGFLLWGAFVSLMKAGVLEQAFRWTFVQQAFGVAWPHLLALLVLFLIALGAQLIIHDFVVPIMYKETIGVCAGWRKVLSLVGSRIADTCVYVLLKIALYIASVILVMFVSFVALAGFIFQGLVGALLGLGIYKFSPAVLHLPYKIAFFVVAIPAVVVLAYFFLCLSLPVAVFFRTLSVQFVNRLIPTLSFIAVCRHCAATNPEGTGFCVSCGAVKKGEVPAKPYRSASLAAIMSFTLGGLGQVYNGQVGKGLIIFFTSWLIVPWIFGIRDAYKTACKINEGVVIAKKRYGCLVAMVVAVAVLAFIVIILAAAASVVSRGAQ